MCIGARPRTGGCLSLVVEGRRGKGRPRKTWRDVINEDLRFLNLPLDMAEDRDKWRKILRDANRQLVQPLKGKK